MKDKGHHYVLGITSHGDPLKSSVAYSPFFGDKFVFTCKKAGGCNVSIRSGNTSKCEVASSNVDNMPAFTIEVVASSAHSAIRARNRLIRVMLLLFFMSLLYNSLGDGLPLG